MNLRHTAFAALLPLVLAGCGGSDTGGDTGGQAGEAASETAPETAPETASGAMAESAAAPAPQPAAEPAAEEAGAEQPAALQPPPAFAQCRSCHSVEPGRHMVGPSLAGIYGTKAGDVAGYNFSTAMKESGLTWDEATLDKYLTAPQQVVPGTKMGFAGLKDEAKRKAVIEYLKAI
ncbi:MAG: c-type cytochrome [Novosphingobium sp.]|nr:c-type cytochrome [Novosphingobium sp.]